MSWASQSSARAHGGRTLRDIIFLCLATVSAGATAVQVATLPALTTHNYETGSIIGIFLVIVMCVHPVIGMVATAALQAPLSTPDKMMCSPAVMRQLTGLAPSTLSIGHTPAPSSRKAADTGCKLPLQKQAAAAAAEVILLTAKAVAAAAAAAAVKPSPTAAPGPRSPSPKSPGRRVSWSDGKGKPLQQHMLFWREDESWLCNKSKCAPTALLSQAANLDLLPSQQARPKHLIEMTTRPLPASSPAFATRLRDQRVLLESAITRAPLAFLTIRVLDRAYEKQVFVRMTTDNWATSKDVEAHYLPGGSTKPGTDRFYATLSVPSYACESLDFAISYTCNGEQTWDSNGGKNYTIAVKRPADICADGLRTVPGGASTRFWGATPSSVA